jgi:hypothetical protein
MPAEHLSSLGLHLRSLPGAHASFMLRFDQDPNLITHIQIIVKAMSFATSYSQSCGTWGWIADLPTSASHYQLGKFSISGTWTDVMKCSHSSTGKSLLLLSVIHIDSVLDFGNHIPDQSCGIRAHLYLPAFTEISRIMRHLEHSGWQFGLSSLISHVRSHLTTKQNGQKQRES